jgi:glycosyltransferase involved in cell wall biosynthesis
LYQSADCGKPVIILQDGGGLTELCDAYSGIITVRPEAADLAHAMDKAVKMKDGHVKSVKKDHSIEIGNILKWVVK